MPVLCILLALIAYSPVFNAEFVNWDDDDYVVKNQSITSFNNIREIVTEPVQGNYHPLTMLSLAANYAVSGTDAGSYHVVNLLLHLLNVCRTAHLHLRCTACHAPREGRARGRPGFPGPRREAADVQWAGGWCSGSQPQALPHHSAFTACPCRQHSYQPQSLEPSTRQTCNLIPPGTIIINHMSSRPA